MTFVERHTSTLANFKGCIMYVPELQMDLGLKELSVVELIN